MALTTEQVLALAPDSGSAAAGRKLAREQAWQGLGRDADALWGECRGSALYQVRVALGDLASKCSCPSRKIPCKHALGLLLLAAATPASVPDASRPEWVRDWLARRNKSAGQAEAKETRPKSPAPSDQSAATAKAKRGGDTRQARVLAGLDALDRWLDDLVRNGLASVETQPATFWERQAARLVDAQAPGLAGRLRRLAAIPNATPDWPARLLDELGRLALLGHAFRRLDALEPALQEDVRGAIGWNLGAEEVQARGERVDDRWLVIGQRVRQEERLRAQASWLIGAASARYALIRQFAHGSQPFAETIVPGSCLDAELIFWPSAAPQRALLGERRGATPTLPLPLPGYPTCAAFFDALALATARQPLLERFPGVFKDVTPLHGGEAAPHILDADGAALPLRGDEHWRLLALAGGRPLDLIAEWDGATLLPLAVVAEGAYRPLTEAH